MRSFPLAFTVTAGVNTAPALVAAGGCWTNVRLVAVAGATVTTRPADVNPGEFAVIVYVPAVLITISKKVDEPSGSVTVLVVPLAKEPVFKASAIDTPPVEIRLLN